MLLIHKIIFRIYRLYQRKKTKFNLWGYKYLWKKQLYFDDGLIFDSTSSINMQSGVSKLVFKKNVHFRKYCSIICSDKAELTLGENVFFNNYCSINCLYKITVGDKTIFGEGVKLYDHNHQYKNEQTEIINQGYSYAEIKIGKNCWIGSNVTILKGVTIGDNVVIGAGCLIYKSIPANSIVKLKQELIIENI